MGYHISNASRAVRNFSNVLCDIAGQYITRHSTDVERNIIKTGYYDIAHFTGNVGAIHCRASQLLLIDSFIVLNATFSNISAIS
jgi:hypothetical protein